MSAKGTELEFMNGMLKKMPAMRTIDAMAT